MTEGEAQALMAHHARSFAPASRLLVRPDRGRVARLYAACRVVDDLADADGSQWAMDRLTTLERDLDRPDPCDPVARDVRRLFADAPEGRAAFAQLVRGVRGDIGPVRIPDETALDAYAQSVAGTVGLMVCALFGIPRSHHASAAALGRAMQITNICRDVLEDARDDRRYLPGTLCPHDPAAIVAGNPDARADVQDAVRILLAEADRLYSSGLDAAPILPSRLRHAVTVAAHLYRDIGHGLLRLGGDPLHGRFRLSRRRRVWLFATGLSASIARPRRKASEARAHA